MRKKNIALIGLGYVGLPLAVEFGKKEQLLASIQIKIGSNSSRRESI